MPLTLQKLLASSAKSAIPFLDDVVNVEWGPLRWTGEMQEFSDNLVTQGEDEAAALAGLRVKLVEAARHVAELVAMGDDADPAEVADAHRVDRELSNEIDRRERALDKGGKGFVRKALSDLIIGWDLMDGDKPYPTDEQSLARLSDAFLRVVFLGLSIENQADPTKGPSSSEPSNIPSSTQTPRSQSGSGSSKQRVRSESRHSSSTKGRTKRASTPSGGRGR